MNRLVDAFPTLVMFVICGVLATMAIIQNVKLAEPEPIEQPTVKETVRVERQIIIVVKQASTPAPAVSAVREVEPHDHVWVSRTNNQGVPLCDQCVLCEKVRSY